MFNERFIIISQAPTFAIEAGFLSQLLTRGFAVTVITNQVSAHDSLKNKADILSCNVLNPLDVISKINSSHIKPVAIFSNSDHLQASTAIVAEFYNLPSKPWSTCVLVKNKSLMRQELLEYKLSNIWQYTINSLDDFNHILDKLTYPLVAKPCFGVASFGVKKILSQAELVEYYNYYWKSQEFNQPEVDQNQNPLILEKYVSGSIYSLETIGDNQNLYSLGGFKTKVSNPPYFIETGAKWVPNFSKEIQDKLIYILSELGIAFGACHTEFVIDENNEVEIIEINYRSAGDQKEFILNNIFSKQYFDRIIDVYLGKNISMLTLKFHVAEVSYLIAENEGVIIKSPDYLLYEDIVQNTCFVPIKHAGENIKITNSNKDYLGIFHVVGVDEQSVKAANIQGQKKINWEIAYA
jgi:biotin carboxylase